MGTQYQKVGQIDLVRVSESTGCLLYIALPGIAAVWALTAAVFA